MVKAGKVKKPVRPAEMEEEEAGAGVDKVQH